MKPNEALLKSHLEGGAFLAGVDRGKWGLHQPLDETDLSLPVLWVRSDKRFAESGRVYLRFDLAGYSQQAPTACPWDVKANAKLAPASWPKGDGVSSVFNPSWRDHALYAPCDRLAMQGHEPWAAQSPQWWWQSSFTITKYLEIVKVPKRMGVEGELAGTVKADTGEFIDFEERWTGAYIFENEWQSFRTRSERDLELKSATHTYPKPGRYTLAVKVIDIFGNDTMTLVPINAG